MCKIVAKLSIFSQPAKKKFIFLSKNSYIMQFFRLFMPFFMQFFSNNPLKNISGITLKIIFV